MCPHCGFHRGDVNAEHLQELQRRKLRDRIYHLKMTSYAVMTLFLAAFGWYWWESADFQAQPSLGPLALLAIGAIAYLINRYLLFRARRQMRQLLS
jgi:polyferredoxin